MDVTINDSRIQELMDKQLPKIAKNIKLGYPEMVRILKFTDKSLFENDCNIWNGYITNSNSNKTKYIGFFFNGKKEVLHRLLYINYVDSNLTEGDYIKHTCKNKGSCVCLKHMIKFEYSNKIDIIKREKKTKKKSTITDDIQIKFD